jgi:hypothetical protein
LPVAAAVSGGAGVATGLVSGPRFVPVLISCGVWARLPALLPQLDTKHSDTIINMNEVINLDIVIPPGKEEKPADNPTQRLDANAYHCDSR